MDKNNQIEHLINKLDHIERVTPSPEFIAKMEHLAIDHQTKKIRYFSLLGIAASILLLATMNVIAIHQYEGSSKVQQVASNDYKLVPTKIFYNE